MADDWIKVRTKLVRDGRVRVAAEECHALTVTMLGALVALWSLGDEHADPDGTIYGYTAEAVDDFVKVPGFCAALPPDWIDLSGKWVKLPDYQDHNGVTAKERAGATKRKRRERKATRDADDAGQVSRTHRDTSVTREEKRREELPVGKFKASVEISQVAGAAQGAREGAGADDGAGISALSDAQSTAVVQACIALRKLGMRVQPAMPPLIALVGAGATVEQLALTAAELALRKANRWNDPDQHPELPELFASGASAAQMGLHDHELAAIKAGAPSIQYLAATLQGRVADAQREHTDGAAFSSDRPHVGRRQESPADRAERKRRAGEAAERDQEGDDDAGAYALAQ